MTSPDIEAALRQERIEIARMLHAEAAKHEYAANELRADYEDEQSDEADAHDQDADTLNRWADLILARTPAEPVSEAPEITF